MARISKGILGGFAGTVGTVIGGNWKGIDYIRSKPAVRVGGATPAQLAHRERFAVVGTFVKAVSELLSIAYQNYPARMSANNHVFGHIMKNALLGEYPDLRIDYSKVAVSSGKLPNAANPAAAASGTDGVRFSWSDNTGTGLAKAGDRAILVIYCDELKECVFDLISTTRNQGNGMVSVPKFTGKTVHTWVSFLSETGKDVAPSFYTGSVVVG
jgi:hypothetical protein